MQAPNQITVRVPASSANLGPGFDALGLALGLHLRCTLRRAESGAPLRIQASGEGASEIPTGESNLIWQAFARAAAELVPPSESIAGVLDGRGLELLVENEIPLGRGLGSSAAAIVAGVALANEYCRAERGRGELIEMASRIEGHPDNVAAAVLGGLVVSCQDAQPRVYAV